MKQLLRNPFFVFVMVALLIAIPLCIFPINLFAGEIVQENGLQKMVIQAPLSLSYFFGLGYETEDMVGVRDFYLTTKGYITAGIFLIGFPALITYRVWLSATKK